MAGKLCPQCLEEKHISDYYVSNRKCKECVKKNVRQRELEKLSTPEGLEKERARHREKYHRLGYKDIHKPTPERKKEIISNYKEKYPEKYRAKNASQDLPRGKGNELHHWSYNEKHWKDVIELSIQDHATLHRFIQYDQETFFYKDLEGNLLDTKEKHLEVISKLDLPIVKI